MMAIAAVTGVSSSAAYHVPSLLLEEMRTLSRWIIFRADIVLLKMEKVEDHDCYCIQGSNQSPHDTTIWVSTHDFSLRRRNHYSVPTCDDQKIMITTRELSASETSDTAEDSLLISLHRPPNLITEKETTEFIELFRESAGRVEKRKFEVTQAMKARLLAGKRSERSFFTEISYEEAEFNTPISPSIFSSIRRD
jgi:hypothetical protein